MPSRGERFADARRNLPEGQNTIASVSAATGVSSSLIQALEDDDNERDVGYRKVATLAQHYGVSADYLMMLTEFATPDTDLRAVCDYTGLSETAVKILADKRSKNKIYNIADTVSLLIGHVAILPKDGSDVTDALRRFAESMYYDVLNTIHSFLTITPSKNRYTFLKNGEIISQSEDITQYIHSSWDIASGCSSDEIVEGVLFNRLHEQLHSLRNKVQAEIKSQIEEGVTNGEH